jgi:hypothetical protein
MSWKTTMHQNHQSEEWDYPESHKRVFELRQGLHSRHGEHGAHLLGLPHGHDKMPLKKVIPENLIF